MAAVPSGAAAQEMMFRRLGAEQGMPQIALWGLCQDGGDNIWAIGDRLLYRYDGCDVQKFSPAPHISDITVDVNGKLWVLCLDRFGWYDSAKGDIVLAEESLPMHCRFITPSREGGVHILSRSSVYEYAGGHIELVRDFGDSVNVTAACFDGSCLLVGTGDGSIFSLDSSLCCRKILAVKGLVQTLTRQDNVLWIGTRGDGMYRAEPATGSVKAFHKGELLSNQVRAICPGPDSTVWVGSLLGLDIIDSRTGAVSHLTKNIFDDRSLSHNTIRCIIRDRQGGMWLGTYYGGLDYWHPGYSLFRHISVNASGRSLNDDVVSCIVEGGDGLIWIGTNKGGVNCYNPGDGSFRYYKISGNSGSEFNDIKAILLSEDGRMVYIGAYGGGFNVLDRRSGAIRRIFSDYDVYDIKEASGGGLWLGTTRGLLLYHPEDGRVEVKFRGMAKILVADDAPDWNGDELFWTGSDASVRRLAVRSDGTVEDVTPPVLSPVCGVTDVFCAGGGLYYISSAAGLFAYDSATETLTCALEYRGSRVAGVNGVERDPDGVLWVSSKSGLYRLDPNGGAVRCYRKENGLIDNVLLEYSHCLLSNGDMMFGGLGGVNVFSPRDFRDAAPCPAPVISRLCLYDVEVRPGDATGILTGTVSGTSSIDLRHDQNNVSFRFSVPDYRAAGTTRFIYRLEGFDPRPYETGLDRTAHYSNLPKGKYSLVVSAVNSDGVTSSGRAVLDIRVHPVWYDTLLARVLEILLLASLVVAVVFRVIRQKEMKDLLRIREIESKYQSEMRKLKALKFINSYKKGSGAPPLSDLSASDESFILSVIEAVENNLSNPRLNVDLLSQMLGLSRSTLLMKVKKLTGGSVLDLIHKVTFTRACELLKDGHLTVAEICYKLGFTSPSYFTSSFKKYVGCTPKEYVDKSAS